MSFKKICFYSFNFILLFCVFNISAQDFSGPEITSLTLSPTNVDLSTGSVTVTASIQVSDTTGVDLSQLNTPYFTGGTPGIVSGYRTFTRWSLISGDKYNGSYEATLELIPSKVPPDSYNLSSSYFYDENGFYSSTSSDSILTVQNQYNVSPTVILTDTDSDNIVSNSDVVTITATFSKSMSATPTLSLTGIISDAQMSATASDSIWTYTWTVSGSTVSSTTATVSGTDLSGNAYSGTDSITFTIDNSNPSLTIIKPTGTYTNQSVVVTLTYDEAVTGLTTDTSQFSEATNIASLTLLSVSSDYKTYTVRITPSSDGLVKLTHAPNSPPVTDSAGNPIASTVSCSFIYDATSPNVTLTDTDSDNIVSNSDVVTITATFSESMSVTPTLSLAGIVSDALMSATASDSIWTYTWTVSTTVTSSAATVSGTDLSGNAYTGSDNILFTIDNSPPEIKMLGPIGYTYVGYHNEHFYFINSGTSNGPKLNWSDAKSAANDFLTSSIFLPTEKVEGGLVVIDSSDENDFIGNYLSDNYFNNSVWTGIYQENDNSNWINRLGESQSYFSWRSDQPSGTNQNAVLFTADPFVQSSSFASESNVWTDEDSSNTNDYIVEIDNFYFEDNANSAKISFYASMETLTWSLSGDDASFFEIDDSDQSGSAQTIFIDFKSAHKGNLTHSSPQDLNGDNNYKLILNVSDAQSNTTSVVINFKLFDTTSPSELGVILTV